MAKSPTTQQRTSLAHKADNTNTFWVGFFCIFEQQFSESSVSSFFAGGGQREAVSRFFADISAAFFAPPLSFSLHPFRLPSAGQQQEQQQGPRGGL
jgi:hypothetical protein